MIILKLWLIDAIKARLSYLCKDDSFTDIAPSSNENAPTTPAHVVLWFILLHTVYTKNCAFGLCFLRFIVVFDLYILFTIKSLFYISSDLQYNMTIKAIDNVNPMFMHILLSIASWWYSQN